MSDEAWQTYADTEHGFSIDIPRSWVTIPDLMGTIVAFAEPEADRAAGFATNVNVVSTGPQRDVEGYVQQQIRSMAELVSGFTLADAERSLRDGVPVVQIDSLASDGDRDLTVSQVHLLAPAATLVASATVPSDRADALATTLDRMLKSFRPVAAELASAN